MSVMRATPLGAGRHLPWSAVAAALLVGCSSSGMKPACMVDADCTGTGDNVCMEGMCKPRPTGRLVAFELTPPMSSTAGPTELKNVMLTGGPLSLAADDKTIVTGTVTSDATLFASEAHVKVTMPSRIPGRPDLEISSEMAMNMFTFTVAQGRVGTDTTAQFRFTPGTAAQFQPPVTLSLPLVSPITTPFPAKMDLIAVNGQLVDKDGRPFVGDSYRTQLSYQRGLVSNVIPTDATGTFRLLVPPDSTPPQPDDLVTLTIGTADNTETLQFVTSPPVSLRALAAATKASPRIFIMPDHLTPVPAALHVTAGGKDQEGVTVRFRAEIPAPPYGNAVYQRWGDTDAQGLVQVPLIPGPAGAPVSYQISIQAPTDARYASRCVPDVAVELNSAAALAPLPPLDLDLKPTLSGNVRDNTDAPVAGARVTATQIAPAATCAEAGGATVSPPTDAAGNYLLNLDPGTYRIEVTPPPNSSWPRRIEDGTDAVTVSHNRVHPIALAAGEMVGGVITASDGQTLLGDTKVTIWAVFCRSAPCVGTPPPEVLAQTTTDMFGNFSAVIPAP